MPSRILEGAMCVQRFDDSRKSAIHNTYRISLRSSSMREPRDPLLKVFTPFDQSKVVFNKNTSVIRFSLAAQARKGSARKAIETEMILPQVHLRKPCYDFYFL
ncbi:unnamed protein product [Kuraishia capsulata CBS 1993]|uniref:Uncharacterized protein n=1 Tax=Kuraishia capsulata CBS 1993 TaxID=1382522 RepID=W6MTK3_9ASCO|nr:unnamed protein product [Kuraishia capsulata CBS 1993]